MSAGGRIQVAALALIAAIALAFPARAQTVPQGYPGNYGAIIAAAKKEGKVVVYSTTDAASAGLLLKDFQAAFPGVSVEYNDLNSTELYNRFISEAAAHTGGGDLLWSSAMDLQVKLVADGYSQAYESPEGKAIPSWANWKNEAYAVTYEPVAFIYNKRLVPAGDVPTSHGDLLKLLDTKADAYRGKVTAYDPERSGVGFLFFTQDARVYKDAWALNKAFGKAQIKLYTSAGAMIERVSSGEHLIGYGIFGSYALARQKKNPNLGIVLPKDYTLIATRIALIAKSAAHPNAAKLFLDYLLSKRGQEIIANKALLYAIRADVDGEATLKAVEKEIGDKARPIPVGPDLLQDLDQKKRLDFLKQWQAAMKGR